MPTVPTVPTVPPAPPPANIPTVPTVPPANPPPQQQPQTPPGTQNPDWRPPPYVPDGPKTKPPVSPPGTNRPPTYGAPPPGPPAGTGGVLPPGAIPSLPPPPRVAPPGSLAPPPIDQNDLKPKPGLNPASTVPGFVDPDATGEIGEIVVDGNEKTNGETVVYIAKIDVGDDWTRDQAELVKTRLASSGLFKEVEIYTERMVTGKIRIHLLVKDKHSWVIAPAFYNQPTNTGGGVGFGENNLLGTGQKLLVYGQVATGDSFFIGAWQLPTLGSATMLHAQFDLYLARSRYFEYATATKYISSPEAVRESREIYLNGGVRLGLNLFKGVKLDTRIRGAKVSFDRVQLASDMVTPDQAGGMNPDGTLKKPGKEGTDVSNEWDLIIDHRANWYGVQTGYKYQASFEHALGSFGSDFHYWIAGASIYQAKQILERHNLIWKFDAKYGHDLPFQQELMMGGTSMRGWLNNQFRGNVRVLSNLEYSAPLFEVWGFGVRGLAFWDSGYCGFTKDEVKNPDRNYLPDAGHALGAAPFKNSIGVGTRFYLRQVVLPLLGLDVGFGLEARDVQVYLAIGLTD